MSMYRQSGGENAGFRTEGIIKHGVCAERATSTLTGRYSETQQALLYGSNNRIPLRALAFAVVSFEVFLFRFGKR